jgi:transposase
LLGTYIPEERRRHRCVWTDKPAAWERAYRNHRRRVKGRRSKRLQRLRSEKVERTFAHVCETGGGRRSWLRGLIEVGKRYLLQVAAHNLGLIMRRVFGRGTPRSLQGAKRALCGWLCGCRRVVMQFVLSWWLAEGHEHTRMLVKSKQGAALQVSEQLTNSTGC